ncbi:MAG: thiamine-phosphate kinase [Gemmatimonadaceae bacterium]|nr:thiamine-phosphate kinase [Gemmatimonadaceae bacterium]
MTGRNDTRPHIPLGPGGEFDIVRRMLQRWGNLARSIGDDAAIVQLPPNGQLVVSTDTSVEDVHFRREWLTHAEIGYRATAAALSDLAAMAAEPAGIFLALTLPETDVPLVDELADGIGECVASAGTLVLGGDVTRGEKLSLTLTVLGTAIVPLLRSGAKSGDRIYVTGRLGGPLRALRELREGRSPGPALRRRFAHPVPRLREARWLAERGARAAIDISDGLIADARHLAVASGVALHLRAESVPALAGISSDDALASGEEYELLVTSPGPLDAAAFRQEFGLELTEIGEARGDEADVVSTAAGRRVAPPAGYDHFTAQ